jgi:hypothetical protein
LGEDTILEAVFLRTLALPFFALDKPIAMSCLLLVTFLPIPVLRIPSFFHAWLALLFRQPFLNTLP